LTLVGQSNLGLEALRGSYRLHLGEDASGFDPNEASAGRELLLFLLAVRDRSSAVFLAVRAGTPVESKATQRPPSPQPAEPWIIIVGAAGWFPFVTGDIGINGVITHVNIVPIDIFRRTDFLTCGYSAMDCRGTAS
jgi:hypothetical protein